MTEGGGTLVGCGPAACSPPALGPDYYSLFPRRLLSFPLKRDQLTFCSPSSSQAPGQ